MTRASRPGIVVQRGRVLEAARVLLKDHGVEHLTAAQVADAAELSRATFYRAYPSVEAVIEALYEEYQARVTRRLVHALEQSGEDATWLDDMVNRVIDDAAEARQVLVAMFREELRPDSPAGASRAKRIDSQIRLISEWWRASSGLPQDTALITVFVLMLQVVGLHVALHPSVTRRMREELKRACSEIITATMTAYRARLASSD